MATQRELVYILKRNLDTSKKEFDEFFDFTPACYVMIEKDGTIEKINFAGAALIGESRIKFIQKNFNFYLSSHSQVIFKKNISCLYETESATYFVVEVIPKKSARCMVEIQATLFKGKSLLLLKNITEIRKAEQELIESKKSLELFENLFYNTNSARAILNLQYQFIVFNSPFERAFTRIFSTKITHGMNLLNKISDFPEFSTRIKVSCEEALIGKESVIYIENPGCKIEAYYCYELNFRLFPGNLHSNKLVIQIKDFTNRKLNEQKLFKLRADISNSARTNALGEMASTLAHELNQPLAAIHLYSFSCLENLKKGKEVNEKLINALKKIEILSVHAGEILHKMKNFMKHGELCTEYCDINDVIQTTLNFLEYHKQEFNFDIDLYLSPLPFLRLDKIKIMQVISNLVQNSIEAFEFDTNKKLIITIKTRLIDKFIKVSFSDNGPGMTKETIRNINKSCYTTKVNGVGLGLAITRTLIKAHGGKLEIKKPVQGVLIHFTLPLPENEI